MILKLLGKVDKNYYELQHEWRRKYPNDDKSGKFRDFKYRVIAGVTFKSRFDDYQLDESFPMEQFFNTIDGELRGERFVLISL